MGFRCQLMDQLRDRLREACILRIIRVLTMATILLLRATHILQVLTGLAEHRPILLRVNHRIQSTGNMVCLPRAQQDPTLRHRLTFCQNQRRLRPICRHRHRRIDTLTTRVLLHIIGLRLLPLFPRHQLPLSSHHIFLSRRLLLKVPALSHSFLSTVKSCPRLPNFPT